MTSEELSYWLSKVIPSIENGIHFIGLYGTLHKKANKTESILLYFKKLHKYLKLLLLGMS